LLSRIWVEPVVELARIANRQWKSTIYSLNRQSTISIGNRQPATGNRQPAIGNREIGNRQSAIGNRQ
jgi:hypothetical protein